MLDPRAPLIRRKNAAFLDYETACYRCEKRRHLAGAVPASWLERLADLRAAYQTARVAWRSGRSRWTG